MRSILSACAESALIPSYSIRDIRSIIPPRSILVFLILGNLGLAALAVYNRARSVGRTGMKDRVEKKVLQAGVRELKVPALSSSE